VTDSLRETPLNSCRETRSSTRSVNGGGARTTGGFRGAVVEQVGVGVFDVGGQWPRRGNLGWGP